ncbi:MAG TPA: F0F1 ATP synthase subunit B [Gemmataceae bacterium]|nr:F0F1 ATP synthase subunit B [Gemmataceae bacterium]
MSRSWPAVLVVVLALAVVLGVPGLALAEGGQKKAEPNIFEPRLDLTIWTIVVFVLLLLVLGKFAWKPMLRGLQQRELNILSAIQDAERAREEAQRMRAQLQKEMDGAQSKVLEILDEARRSAERLHAEMTAKAKADIQAEKERMQREMETAHDQAMQDLVNRAAELATLISTKAIRRNLSPDDHRRLVDDALADLRAAGNGHPG